FTPETLDLLMRIRRVEPAAINWRGLAGNALVLTLMALFLFRYVQAHQKNFHRVKNLYTMALTSMIMTTVGSWVGLFIARSVADQYVTPPFNDATAYIWALPVCAGAMLITLLANDRFATVCSAFTAVVFGIVMSWNAQAMVFALLSSFAAIYGVRKYGKRTAILKAGFLVGLLNATTVLALQCIKSAPPPASQVLFEIAAAFAGGLLAVPVASFGLPIMEWLFNALTDIRLLELSNLDNPLLRRLSLEAPGTYNHSVIVGTLAEQAAEEIGAHALFCRVAAYYHDIGKMTKPDYFVENMRDGENRHDRLSPRMSSLIIASHVKEGIRLSEEFNLPRQVRDIIPQHHGTRLITFFYRKAKKKEDIDAREIHESDYRYPGPKPQTKEAAIFMMADSVEAAARSVEDPTPAKFEEVIRAVSNAIVLDQQLDECDLTFSDLAKIGASFQKTLTAVHHHRIAYPGFEFDRSRPRAVEAE
ncbi:MAG TPA: HDIG domain-containing protein, partial [Candidatus Polarisedimenticolia bacterium]|nr:HDIG domain-containing protein [Candidatus Polarisedimenticolia bacterium]